MFCSSEDEFNTVSPANDDKELRRAYRIAKIPPLGQVRSLPRHMAALKFKIQHRWKLFFVLFHANFKLY